MLHQKDDHEEKKNSLKFCFFLNPKQKMERIDKVDFKK